MNTPNPIEIPPGLIDRVKNIILKPKEEWPVIEGEQASISGLYMKYALILAAIPALATFLRATLFGYGAFGFSYRPSFGSALSMAISQYVMALVGVAILAFIADFIVTKFDGTANRISAFKLAIYSATASWLAGVFMAVPGLSILGLLGLYSLYLLYTGLTPLMKVPAEKAMACTAVIAIAAIVLSLIAGALVAPVSGMFGGHRPLMGEIAGDASGGTVSVPGLGTVDTGKLEEASQKMQAAIEGKTDAKPVDVAQLKALLPESLGGYSRTSIETSSMGAAGVGGAQASADYEKGDQRLKVELTDIAAMGAFAGIGAALNVNQEKEDASGFERTRTENGGMVQEKWNTESKRGQYTHMVGGRFMVSVEGDADSFDQLKAMASGINMRSLAALAK